MFIKNTRYEWFNDWYYDTDYIEFTRSESLDSLATKVELKAELKAEQDIWNSNEILVKNFF